jgi:hypothetical protein
MRQNFGQLAQSLHFCMKYGLTKVHCQGIIGKSVVNFFYVAYIQTIGWSVVGQTGLKSCRDLTTVITADGR